MKEGDLNRHW